MPPSRKNSAPAVAGSCSATRVQCLKQVRGSHIHDSLGLTWDEFCTEHAGIRRGTPITSSRNTSRQGHRALNPALPSDGDRAALCGLAVYTVNKFRNLARQLGAAV